MEKTADDVMWRRTKLGLHMSEDERTVFTNWFKRKAKKLTKVLPDTS